jgi:hypothetical protein
MIAADCAILANALARFPVKGIEGLKRARAQINQKLQSAIEYAIDMWEPIPGKILSRPKDDVLPVLERAEIALRIGNTRFSPLRSGIRIWIARLTFAWPDAPESKDYTPWSGDRTRVLGRKVFGRAFELEALASNPGKYRVGIPVEGVWTSTCAGSWEEALLDLEIAVKQAQASNADE